MKFIKNQRGDTFIMALVLLAAAGALFVGAQTVSESSLDRLNTYKVRAQMNILEQRVRMTVNQPMAFANCNSQEGVASCTLNQTYLDTYFSNTGIGSEFRVTNRNLNSATRVFTATLEYTGPYKIKNTNISIKIPDELLQSPIFSCPPERPVFQGLNPATGKIICRELVKCGPGEFLRGVNATTADSICMGIPVDPKGCAPNYALSEWTWIGSDVRHNCKPALNPFNYFGGP